MDDEAGERTPERDAEAPDAAAPDLAQLRALWGSAESSVSSNARSNLPPISAEGEAAAATVVQPVESPQEVTDQSQQPEPALDESEVFFLIADFLKRRSTCQKAADTLIQELAEHQLLQSGVDWQGRPRTATYEDYRLRHRDIAPTHLVELLKGAARTFDKPATNFKDAKKAQGVQEQKRSLLLKSRVKKALTLPVDERRKLAKSIVSELFRLRGVLKTLRVVEKVIKKYERYQKYTTVSRVDELPLEVQQLLLNVNDAAMKADDSVDKVTTLAADVRALKQLFQLRQERDEIEKQVEALMDKAKLSNLFQTTARTGRNQMSLLRRREVSSLHDNQLPPAYVYSRVRHLKTLSGHLQIQAYCLAYDKTGKYVITGSDDRLVKIWSLRTGDLMFTLRGHVGNITDLAVNSANTLVASSSDDKTVRVWELSTGFPVAVLVGHSAIVNSVRFHPSENIVVTASDDGQCFCYKLPDIPPVDGPETKIETARRLFSLKAYMLSLHPICKMSHTRREGVRSCKVHCIAYSRCGDFVVSGSHDGIARVWDLSTICAPNAPAVVPRFQPTDEPQAPRVLPAGGNEVPNLISAVTIPPIEMPAPMAEAAVVFPMAAQVQQQQPPLLPTGPGMTSFPVEAFPAVVPPSQRFTGGQRPPLQPQNAPQAPFVPQNAPQVPLLPQNAPQMPLLPQNVPQAPLLPQNAPQAPLLPQNAPQAPLLPQNAPQAPLLPRNVPQAPLLPQNVQQAPSGDALQRGTGQRRLQPPQVRPSDLPSVTLSDVNIPSIEPIALLKGHKGPVTSVVYNHKGDRIATASIKDSAARIWKWKRKYKSLHATVLVSKESVENDDISALYGVQSRKKPAFVVDTLTWTHDDTRLITLQSLKMSSQSSDHMWEQRIRVWDTVTGNLKMTLGAKDKDKRNGHVNAAFALDTHPTDWRIVFTAGYDGRAFLWDISTGRMLKSFVNLSPHSKPLANLDGGFTPDGNGFCFTDQIGRLLIFGTGSGEEYAATPVQQYFLHDYVMLVTDGHYNVVDRETNELPSMMQSGPLMDASLVQYPHQPPHLMPNQSLLTPEDYEKNRQLRIQQCKESEMQCGVRYKPEDKEDVHSFPLAIIDSEQGHSTQPQSAAGTDALALARASYRLSGAPVMLSELRRRGFGPRRHVRRRESPTEERDTSVLELEISSDDDRSDEDFQVPTPRHAAEEEEEDEEDDEEDEDDFDEDDLLSDNEDALISPANARRRRLRSNRQRASPGGRFPTRGRRLQSEDDEEEDTPRQLRSRRNRARSRLVLDSDGEEEQGVAPDQRMGEVGDGSAGLVGSENQSRVVVETNDGFIMGDNHLDRFDTSMTYADMLEMKRSHLRRTQEELPAENTDDALIPCAFCGVGDDGAMLKLPADGMGVHPLINGSQRVFVHDQCAIASPLCFNRDGNWYNVTREIRRGRSLTCVGCNKRGATVGCTVEACRNSYHWKCAINFGWSVDQMHFYCPDHQSRRERRHREDTSNRVATEDGGAVIEPASKRFGLKFHREWLQLVSLRSIHQYVPQVGDYVVYLPEGHPGYLRFGGMPPPRYFARLSKFYAVKCRVVNVKYVFPTADEFIRCSTIKCEISLAVLAVPTSAVRPPTQIQEGEETKEEPATESMDLFNPESSPFAEFTSVDDQLNPATSEPSTRFTFKALYHSNDVANFLVLDHVYESGVCGNWKVGDRVQMPFVQLNQHGLEVEAKLSYGKIESIIRKPMALSGSEDSITPWECITVDWDSPDDDTCAVCPWELEPESADELREKRELSLRRGSTRLFFSRSIIGEKRDALLQELDTVLSLSISRDFMYPVDEDTFLDYLITVANPMDLTKVQRRLQQGYYRQVEAFLADAKLISINCETYNVQSSAIAQNSRSLFSALLTAAQRHFPHLLREFNNTNPWEAGDGQTSTASFSYPPDDFLSNFAEDPEETQLELLSIELLSPSPEEANAEPAPAPVVEEVSPTAHQEEVASPTATRRATRSQHVEGRQADEEETNVELTGDHEPVGESVQQETAAEVSDVASHAPTHELTSPTRSPRVRRTPRVITTPASGESARKRQRKNPELELLTYSDLLENLTVAQRDAVRAACEEDLRAVLQDFHDALVQADVQDIFAMPVTDDQAPQYSEIISHPQDFGSMMDRLPKYKSFREYFADVELVFSNAITYNGWDCYIGGLVQDLQKYCVKFILDAAGVEHQGHKASSRKPSRAAKSSALRSKASPAKSSKQRSRRRPAAVLDDDEEDSWHSSSESEEEDDDDEDEDDDLSSVESDWEGAGRKRRLRQSARPSHKKKSKRRY